MVGSKQEGSLIYNIRLSSIGPGHVTGQDVVYEPSNIDLAMKLHYHKMIYYLRSQAFGDMKVTKIKEPTFLWLNQFYMTCGRFRRSEFGRPYIKCNDCGVRFIEAKCDLSLEEWLQMKDDSHEKLLVSSQVLGPELTFSPPVYIQMTKFKCGGVALGLSVAHVLGDAFSMVGFFNVLGKIVAGEKPVKPLNLAQSLTKSKTSQSPIDEINDPLSVKRVGPVGDLWIADNNYKMEPFSFNISPTQLSHLESKLGPNKDYGLGPFEILSAVFWHSIAKIRNGPKPKRVTICRKDPKFNYESVSNSQVISVVEVDFSVTKASPSELAEMIKNDGSDDRKNIDDAMENGNGVCDFIMYGANLTFVNLEKPEFYEFNWKGHKPISASYRIDGVGSEGAIFVLPGRKDMGKIGSEGRMVTVILPENEIIELKGELNREWSIV